MSAWPALTIKRIQSVFEEEVAARGGRATEAIVDEERLFAKSVFPDIQPVSPGDRVQGGVAVRADTVEICVHPYVFRQVCRNGAIMAQTLGSQRFDVSDECEPDEVLEHLRQAVGACCEPGVFSGNVQLMRTAMDGQVDLALMLMPMISRLGERGVEMLSMITERFFRGGDRSRFGLMNAVTSLARDTRDPETRWNLEELGGGIAVQSTPVFPQELDSVRRPDYDAWDVPVGAR